MIKPMEETPTDVMVLGAIKGGAKKFDQIKKIVKIEAAELNNILERLESRGLIKIEEKKGWFGAKVEIRVTDKGEKEMQQRIHELENNWNQMRTIYESGDKQKLQQHMDDNKSILPMMFFFGIIDMIMFSTMIGFIGAQMSDYAPAEQVAETEGDTGDVGNDGGGDAMSDGGFDIDIGF
jgi:DNA-binding HxlR family transcriptional regulator